MACSRSPTDLGSHTATLENFKNKLNFHLHEMISHLGANEITSLESSFTQSLGSGQEENKLDLVLA